MPFEPIPTVTAPAKDAMVSVSYKRNLTKHGRNKNPKLIIGIPKDLCQGFTAAPADLFSLQLGTGADAGKVRIVKAAKGVKPTTHKGAIVFRFGFVPLLGQDAAEREHCDAKQIPGGFEITAPAWFKSDEQPARELYRDPPGLSDAPTLAARKAGR